MLWFPPYRLASLVVGLCVALQLGTAGPAAHAQQRPNIILMVSDDGGYADYGFMNQFTGKTTEFKTPNLDALAAQSRVMSNAYVASSVCAASRAAFLTGRQGIGFEYNISNANDPRDGLQVNEVMMQEALQQAGYTTGVFGKWHVGSEVAKQPQNQGVDEFYGILAGSRPYFATGGVPVRRNATNIQWQDEASFNNIAPDPTQGRHFTDALGDEASKFVATHANQNDPFFMYVPFTAPHGPYVASKQQDRALFESTSLSDKRKNVAALTYAMDRAVGNILARVNDPNGDGDTSDSIADNTIIVFTNDNGGAAPFEVSPPEPLHDNGPLYYWKASAWEGGLRVPMLVHMPGAQTGVFNEMVSTLDLMPTFLAAAGVNAPATLHGKDLAPYIEGMQTGAVHDALFWRGGVNYWAIRKGDWKLVHGTQTAGFQLYKLNPDGSGESPELSRNNSDPQVFESLLKEFVDWEATLAKPVQTTSFFFNRFDAFRFRQNLATTVNWREGNVWADDSNPAVLTSMMREDSYANASLVFQPRNDASYTSNNNISRAVGLYYTHIDSGQRNRPGLEEFMLNELRFDGEFSGAAAQSGTLTGFPLMFVKSLSGVGPTIKLQNVSTTASNFTFNVNMAVVLHADLEITGNSSQPFAINGQIRDFDEPRSLTKSGTSAVTLSANNTYFGSTIVNGGTLRIQGASAALANTSKVQIGSQGTVVLASGRIHTPQVSVAAGGTFNFTGGVLETSLFSGNLVNNGGTFRPGLGVGAASIADDFVQNAGTLAIEIGGLTPGTQFDQLLVGDDVSLGASLAVTLVNLGGGTFSPAAGSSFEILRAGGAISGAFDAVSAPALSGNRKWAIKYGATSVWLQVVNSLAADFDHNGIVDEADLGVWRNTHGVNASGDADGDGDTDGNDFLIWQQQVGTKIVPSLAASLAVPEPNAALLAAMAAVALATRRPKRRPGEG